MSLRISDGARRLLADERGQSATEYLLIAGLISVPMYIAFRVVFLKFLQKFVTKLIATFTTM